MTDIRKLEQELAYSAARSDIECICTPMPESFAPGERWLDTSGLGWEDAEWVSRAVQYLESRNLLKHHPENPALVRVLDA